MVGITHDRINEINLGDDAEDAVVGAIRKTGKVLLKEWVEKKRKQEKKLPDKMRHCDHMKKKVSWQTSLGRIETIQSTAF